MRLIILNNEATDGRYKVENLLEYIKSNILIPSFVKVRSNAFDCEEFCLTI